MMRQSSPAQDGDSDDSSEMSDDALGRLMTRLMEPGSEPRHDISVSTILEQEQRSTFTTTAQNKSLFTSDDLDLRSDASFTSDAKSLDGDGKFGEELRSMSEQADKSALPTEREDTSNHLPGKQQAETVARTSTTCVRTKDKDSPTEQTTEDVHYKVQGAASLANVRTLDEYQKGVSMSTSDGREEMLPSDAVHARRDSIGESERCQWTRLNEALREQGFNQVSLLRPGGSLVVPDVQDTADIMREILSRYSERSHMIQNMSLELNKLEQTTSQRDESLITTLRRQNNDMSKRLAETDARVEELQEDKRLLQQQLTKDHRRFVSEKANLTSQLNQSEHRVKAKEAAAQLLRDKLRDEVHKESLRGEKRRESYSKGRDRNVHHSRSSEIPHGDNGRRAWAEDEMDSLRAQVTRLGDELRDKENTILRYELGPDSINLGDAISQNGRTNDELKDAKDRLAESERNLRVAQHRVVKSSERSALIEREREEAQSELQRVQDVLANVQLELSSRPSIRKWRESQRRIQDLEKKVARAVTQAKEAVDAAELRRWVDTRELMQRDRANHRLKLDRLDHLPTDIMKQVVQDSCRILGLDDVSLVRPSIAKLAKTVQVLPRIERFVNSVCTFVFRHSREVLAMPSDSSLSHMLQDDHRTMEDVLPLLQLWLARAEEPIKCQEFRRNVVRVMALRQHHSQMNTSSSGIEKVILSGIEELIDLERRVLEEALVMKDAQQSVDEDPDLPVNRVIRHFQLLFDVNSIAGCTPKLNEVYRFCSEAHNFFRSAGDLLNMPQGPAESVMKRLEAVLQERRDVNPEACLLVSHCAESWTEGEQSSQAQEV